MTTSEYHQRVEVILKALAKKNKAIGFPQRTLFENTFKKMLKINKELQIKSDII